MQCNAADPVNSVPPRNTALVQIPDIFGSHCSRKWQKNVIFVIIVYDIAMYINAKFSNLIPNTKYQITNTK